MNVGNIGGLLNSITTGINNIVSGILAGPGWVVNALKALVARFIMGPIPTHSQQLSLLVAELKKKGVDTILYIGAHRMELEDLIRDLSTFSEQNAVVLEALTQNYSDEVQAIFSKWEEEGVSSFSDAEKTILQEALIDQNLERVTELTRRLTISHSLNTILNAMNSGLSKEKDNKDLDVSKMLGIDRMSNLVALLSNDAVNNADQWENLNDQFERLLKACEQR